jgi:membrane-bound lytic murein transglycosylase B
MSTSWRFVQIVFFSSLLAACSSTSAPTANGTESGRTATGSGSTASSGSQAGTGEILPGGAPVGPLAASVQRPEVQRFARELASSRNLSEPAILLLLDEARYSATVARLIAPVATGQARPPKSWQLYRGRRLDPITIQQGRAFMQSNAAALDRATKRYGVPQPVIAALIGVETLYGKNMGNFRALDALATLAFDYPDPARPERAAMFRNNLADLIELDLTGKLNARTLKGSYAGAVGIPQFMPSSIKRFAVSADGGQQINLTTNRADAIMSVANYLVEHGWQRGLPIFVPVVLPNGAEKLVDGGLKPNLDWQQLQAAGAKVAVTPQTKASSTEWMAAALGVIDLPEESTGTFELRTATANFFAITQYNHSYFYAAAITDLADALASR